MLPLYVAVMLWVPEVSFAVVNVTAPPLRATVFRSVVPSWKVYISLDVPLNCGETLAVKVADCPTIRLQVGQVPLSQRPHHFSLARLRTWRIGPACCWPSFVLR